jgi:hypothetical protein
VIQVSITFTHEATLWLFALPPTHREVMDKRLHDLAADPASVRTLSWYDSQDRQHNAAYITAGSATYRVDFAVDIVMQKRLAMPAIHVLSGKRL